MAFIIHFGWPQGLWLALVGLTLVIHVSKHGQTRTYCGPCYFLDALIGGGLLWWGGFFG